MKGMCVTVVVRVALESCTILIRFFWGSRGGVVGMSLLWGCL